MSKQVPKEVYEKTRSYKFKQWLSGTKDPFLDTVEMKPQKEFYESEKLIHEHALQHQSIVEKAYDLEHNAQVRLFQKIYNIFSVIFCLCLVFILLVGRSAVMRKIRSTMKCRHAILSRAYRRPERSIS